MNFKKGAMEMSIGTIVVIVLLMVALVLGIYLTQQIFQVGTSAVDGIDNAIRNEINSLFSEDSSKKIIIYPEGRLIEIKKGNSDYLGFALSIRSDEEGGDFSYNVRVNDPDIRDKCRINAEEAESWIKLGKSGEVTLPPSSVMDDPIFIRFLIPDDAPACGISYGVDVKKNGAPYGNTVNVDLIVESE